MIFYRQLFFFILCNFVCSYCCTRIPSYPTKVNSQKAILLYGEVTNVECSVCDKKPSVINHSHNNSANKKNEKCPACIIVVKPIHSFSMPAFVRSIHVKRYQLMADCSSQGMSISKEEIGKNVFLSGEYDKITTIESKVVGMFSPRVAFVNIHFNSPNHFYIEDKRNHNIITNPLYISGRDDSFDLHKNINLLKHLIKIDKCKSDKDKIQYITQLMLYGLDSPFIKNEEWFEKVVINNLRNSSKWTIKNILQKQKKLARKERNVRNKQKHFLIHSK